MFNKIKQIIKQRLNRGKDINNISYKELKELVKNGAILIDVRSKQEFEEEHLNQAISIPLNQIANKINLIVIDKTKPIILYCKSATRSNKAYTILKESGYLEIYVLDGGLEKYF